MVTTRFSLTPRQSQLVEMMRQLNFGSIERLTIRDGKPVFCPSPVVLRDIKLGGENGPRPVAQVADFAVKQQIVELFEQLSRVKSGVVHKLTVKHGLPFSLVLEETPESTSPSTGV